MLDNVYRYLRYSEFLDILTFERLTLRYPGYWPDKLEYLFLKSFEKEQELEKLANEYNLKYPEYSYFDVRTDFQIISSILIKTRCQCWTHKENDLIMWNERNSPEAIRISVPSCAFDSENDFIEGNLIHKDVNYVPSLAYQTIVDLFVKNGRTVTDFVSIKKSVFQYEQEHRLILLPPKFDFSVRSYGYTLSESLCRHFYGIKSEFGLADKYIPFNIQNIQSVMISPYSTDEFAKIVQHDCERFSLRFEGVSSILN